MSLCVSVSVLCEKDTKKQEKKEEKSGKKWGEKWESLSLQLHKTKRTVMSFGCVLVGRCAHVCVWACYSWQCSLSVYSPAFPERPSPLFSQREKETTQREGEKGVLKRWIDSEWKARLIRSRPCTDATLCMCVWRLVAQTVTRKDQSTVCLCFLHVGLACMFAWIE